MRATLTALVLAAAALPAAGCFSNPKDIVTASRRPDLCTGGPCRDEERRRCASIEGREHGCDRSTAPLPTAVTENDLRRQEKDLRKRAR